MGFWISMRYACAWCVVRFSRNRFITSQSHHAQFLGAFLFLPTNCRSNGHLYCARGLITQSGQFSDLELILPNGARYKAHRIILKERLALLITPLNRALYSVVCGYCCVCTIVFVVLSSELSIVWWIFGFCGSCSVIVRVYGVCLCMLCCVARETVLRCVQSTVGMCAAGCTACASLCFSAFCCLRTIARVVAVVATHFCLLVLVVWSSSGFFHERLSTDLQSTELHLDLEDERNVFADVLRFMYSNEIVLSSSNSLPLLAMANGLNMDVGDMLKCTAHLVALVLSAPTPSVPLVS
jgi:BTB/POZ domain